MRRKYAANCFLLTALLLSALLSACASTEEFELKIQNLNDEITACKGRVDEQRALREEDRRRCDEDIASVRAQNDTLVESNSRLAAQLESGKVDQVSEVSEVKSLLQESEFHVRELEDTIMDKERLIRDLERELDGYSEQVRSALEAKQEALRDRQRAFAEESKTRATLNRAFDELSVEFDKHLIGGAVTLSNADDRLLITLQNSLLYSPAQVELNASGLEVMATVSAVINKLAGWTVAVGAHTDDVKIGSSLKKKFPSNWELSTARAMNVVHFFEEKGGIEPAMLSATGYSQFRPIAPNETREGRAKNGRIEILVTPPEVSPEESPKSEDTDSSTPDILSSDK